MTFFERLEILTKKNNYTFEGLGKEIGVTGASINGWKTKGTIPKADTACRIARLYNVSVEWLVTGQELSYSQEVLELADEILKLPVEYQNIIKTQVTQFQEICFKVAKASTPNIS